MEKEICKNVWNVTVVITFLALEWLNVIVAFKCKHFQLNHTTTYSLWGLRKDKMIFISGWYNPSYFRYHLLSLMYQMITNGKEDLLHLLLYVQQQILPIQFGKETFWLCLKQVWITILPAAIIHISITHGVWYIYIMLVFSSVFSPQL